MERVKGIEPSLRAWEAPVLPLNYTRTINHLRQASLLACLTTVSGAALPSGGWHCLLTRSRCDALGFHDGAGPQCETREALASPLKRDRTVTCQRLRF